MQTEILLNGISFEQLESTIKTIVSETIENAVAGITSTASAKPNELITRKETADLLGVSLPTLHAWTKNGVIPAKRIGSRVRYEKSAVLEALKDVETIKYRRA